MADNNQPVPSLGDELVPPPSKKTKYKSKFHPEWEKEFAGITAYRQDCRRAHCSYCQTNFSVAHGGRHDVVKHVGRPPILMPMTMQRGPEGKLGYSNYAKGKNAHLLISK